MTPLDSANIVQMQKFSGQLSGQRPACCVHVSCCKTSGTCSLEIGSQAAVSNPTRLFMHAFALSDWLKSFKTNGASLKISIDLGCFVCRSAVLQLLNSILAKQIILTAVASQGAVAGTKHRALHTCAFTGNLHTGK
ncbi:TPA: hypothetical protein ACH3X1_001689 [Trebouxia sp. C0004]